MNNTTNTNEKLFLVEIIRYGSMSLGVHIFGIFNESFENILKRTREYNNYRGGKYPEFFISEFEVNTEMPFASNRKRYNLKGEEIDVNQQNDW